MIVATTFDFLSLVEKDTELRRVATTEGGEYAGPCPLCKAGRDRFHVQPHREAGARWMCRYCTDGKWKDLTNKAGWIDYLMRRDGLDYETAATLLQSEFPSLPLVSSKLKQTEIIRPVYLEPPESWQEMAERIITQGEAELWGPGGEIARDYLRSRGIREETAREFRLGYSPGRWEKIEGRMVRVSAGVLLPCIARQSVWYIKTRLLPGIVYACRACKAERSGPGPCPCGEEIPRYVNVPGSKAAAIFNAPALLRADVGLLVEGEFDAIIAAQELDGLGIAAVTVGGSASNMPDLATWGDYLIKPKRLAAAYDNDDAGKKGLEMLAKLAPKVERLSLQKGKDINDVFLGGGDLRAWAIHALKLPESTAVLEPPPAMLEDPELLAERELRTTWANDAGAYLAQIREDIAHYEKRKRTLEDQERALLASPYPGDIERRQALADAITRTLAGLHLELAGLSKGE